MLGRPRAPFRPFRQGDAQGAPSPVVNPGGYATWLMEKVRGEFNALYLPFLEEQVALLKEIRDLIKEGQK